MVAPNGYNIAYSFDPDKDGWYELGCVTTGPGVCGNGVSDYRDGGLTVDLLLGGWQPNSKALSYAALGYILHSDGKYYLAAANLNRTNVTGAYLIDTLFSSGADLDPDWQTTDIQPPHTNLQALPPYSLAVNASPLLIRETTLDWPGSGAMISSTAWRAMGRGRMYVFCIVQRQAVISSSCPVFDMNTARGP